MTDQTIPACKVRPILDEWERIKEDADWADMDNLVQNIRALLPAPTLADMTPEEREACQWMQCDVTGFQGQWVLATLCDDDDEDGLIAACGEICWSSPSQVTPRPDLPRLEWPGTEEVAPAPAPDKPSLPGGWRLADHKRYGRVIVTSAAPDADGYVYFVSRATGPIGNDWHLCTPDTLTFLDGPGTPPGDQPAPEVHPGVTVGEPVTDPQVMLGISIDAPDGTVVVGHTPDCHPKATVKSGSTWQSTAGMRAHLHHALGAPDYSELESVTVVRWGKEADQ